VYASSAAVYGDSAALPLTEDGPARPLSAYGADKLGCEQQALVAGVVHGVPTAGLRFFNVFGPRQDPASPYSGVISIFCDRLRAGQGLTVFGDGQQTRDFVFVGDVVAALLAALQGAGVAAPVFNVCTGRTTTVLTLANQVGMLCGVVPAIRHAEPRRGEIRHSLGSPAAAREQLGFIAATGLREGLAETLAWMRAGRAGLAPTLTRRSA